MRILIVSILIGCFGIVSHAQLNNGRDAVKGRITEDMAWWDVSNYHLDIAVNVENKSIQGSNTIRYKVLKPNQRIQIDLQVPMEILKVTQDDKELNFNREGNTYIVQLEKKQVTDAYNEIIVQYSGKPKVAPVPPWDSGMVWEKDNLGHDFISSISWGANSSLWWPCKDQMPDEVDSMTFSINVPKHLVAVANGRLLGVDKKGNDTKTYHWTVSNPINLYSINFNIGNYVHFSEVYNGEKGPLDCTYYVLEHDLKKAKNQFKQVPMMLEAFEHWFGPYPFYEDSYKLIDVPYSGMEHQSAITYGNGYQNGLRGNDASQTGWGDQFDYIIVHESGHEWFANNITFKDIADIWIHESFTTYSEGLFVEYHYGTEAGNDYQIGLRAGIRNDRPMIGTYQVNDLDYSDDNYAKGAAVLHMLRQVVNDDKKWREMLRGLGKTFYHQTVSTEQIEDYLSTQTGIDLSSFWNQYLRTTQIPTLEYYYIKGKLIYKWTNAIKDFTMPLKVTLNGKETWLYPKTNWQKMEVTSENLTLTVDRNFYVPSFFSNSN